MKLEVNLSKKYFFILLGAILVLAGAIYGYAFGGSEPEIMGHSFGEIDFPVGTIMAFNLENCPEGWNSADGTEGTLDLRGAFVRGIGGELNGRDVARSLGDFQGDAIRNIFGNIGRSSGTAFYNPSPTGAFYRVGGASHDGDAGLYYGGYFINFDASRVVPTTTNDNRPKNVAVLYCQKV